MPRSTGRRSRHPQEAGQEEVRTLPTRGLAALAGLGMVVSAWLTVLHYSGPQTTFCPQGSGCATVDASPYSSLLGIPVALIGLAGYGLVLLLVLWPGPTSRLRLALHLSAVAGFSFTLYLVYLQWSVIEAFCPYCVVSAVTMTSILILVLVSRTALPVLPGRQLLGLSMVVAVVVVGGAALAPTSLASQRVEDPFAAGLAQHLTNTGAVMYGAYWCPHCKGQQEDFGAAFKYVTYVECDARGKNGNPTLCKEKGIRAFPTWEISGALYEGHKPLQALAQLSGYSQ